MAVNIKDNPQVQGLEANGKSSFLCEEKQHL